MDQPTSTIDTMGRRRSLLPPSFHYCSFRIFWLGSLASVTALQMHEFALIWLLFQLTDSSGYLLGFAMGLSAWPMIISSVVGGVVADWLDRRWLIIAIQIALAALLLLLGTLVLLDLVQPWQLVTVFVVIRGVDAFGGPPRLAFYPSLINHSAIMSATALNNIIQTAARIVVPAATVLLVGIANFGIIFYLASLGFLIMAILVFLIRTPDTLQPTSVQPEGASISWQKFPVIFLLIVALFSSFFAYAYFTLLPLLLNETFLVGASGFGALIAVMGVGGLMAGILLAYWDAPRYQGLPAILGALLFGLFIAIFGISAFAIGSYFLALLIAFLVGAAGIIYGTAILSFLQSIVPDQWRGRVMGFYGMIFGFTSLASILIPMSSEVIGDAITIALGGAIITIFVGGSWLISRKVRQLLRVNVSYKSLNSEQVL